MGAGCLWAHLPKGARVGRGTDDFSAGGGAPTWSQIQRELSSTVEDERSHPHMFNVLGLTVRVSLSA